VQFLKISYVSNQQLKIGLGQSMVGVAFLTIEHGFGLRDFFNLLLSIDASKSSHYDNAL